MIHVCDQLCMHMFYTPSDLQHLSTCHMYIRHMSLNAQQKVSADASASKFADMIHSALPSELIMLSSINKAEWTAAKVDPPCMPHIGLCMHGQFCLNSSVKICAQRLHVISKLEHRNQGQADPLSAHPEDTDRHAAISHPQISICGGLTSIQMTCVQVEAFSVIDGPLT